MWNDNREFDSMIYLLYCALNDAAPDASRLEGIDGGKFAALCKQQQLSALVYMAAEKLDAAVFGEKGAEQLRADALQAIRVNVLFEMERMQVFGVLQRENIPYMPLKGCVLKQYYPEAKRREMGDVDVLIDSENAERIRELMISLGYACEDFGETHHDEYFKEPFYTFEMHRSLSHHFGDTWDNYYEHIREKLLPSGDGGCELRFTDEDFYLYLFIHGYRHYQTAGIGVKFLTDIFCYLRAVKLDEAYLEQELTKLGVKDEERFFRNLAFKVFSPERSQEALTAQENGAMEVLLMAGAYGSDESAVKLRLNQMSEDGGAQNKMQYIGSRLTHLPPVYTYRYPRLYRCVLTRPIVYGIRLWDGVTKKRGKISAELQTFDKMDSQ